MGYQMSDYELRAGYIAIRTAEDMERISGKKVVATNDYLIQLKRDLREWIKRNDGEPRNVIFFDGGGRIALEELPVNPEWCREDVEAWFTENRYIHGVNSQYDCTGCLFTAWFKVFRRRGRWYAYHCIGMDI